MNKLLVGAFVILASTLFGLIFIKQIKTNTGKMADFFAREVVAGTSTVNHATPSDSSDKIERSLNSTEFESMDENSAKIEVEMQGL